jgi:hypothetical protein
MRESVTMFNKWFAGFIEGDGTIIVPEIGEAQRYPFIRIAFHKKDLPLAKKLSEILKYGNIIEDKGSKNCILWSVTSLKELRDIIDRINGNMRTPKVHRLEALIDWMNARKEGETKKRNEGRNEGNEGNEEKEIIKKGLDSTPIGSNSWLSGMSDADSNFNIILTDLKNSNYRVVRQWRLEFAQKTYHGKDQGYWAMEVSSFLGTNLLSRSRIQEIKGVEKMYSSFMVVAHNKESIAKIEEYFNKFPLKSAKYLDFKDWEACGEYTKTKSKENYDKVIEIKNKMNSKRTQFDWSHIN